MRLNGGTLPAASGRGCTVWKERDSLHGTACGRRQSRLLGTRAPSPALLPANAGQALGGEPGPFAPLSGFEGVVGGAERRGKGNINKARTRNLHFLAQSILEGLETGTGGGARDAPA